PIFVTLGIAAFAVVILYVTKEFVNPRVTLGTVISYAFDLKKNYNVKIVGTIPTGIPPPEFPDLSVLQPSMAVEIITVAIIAFSVCVSLAKIFGKKYNYEELIAYGICNTVGAFFHCWPAGSSLSRSAVQDSMGGKTQVAALVSSTLLLCSC
uniref:Sulfate_transp domain-containing protein n=1 Tax=Macrostomum lignano TaxID=282301 RepID=A0A1I8FDJ3_9PLAT